MQAGRRSCLQLFPSPTYSRLNISIFRAHTAARKGGPVGINYLAVIVAALSGFAVGAVWYGPLFGKQWMLVSGVQNDQPRMNVPGMYGLTFVLSLVAAVVLALVIHGLHATGVVGGARTGFLLWLGFILTVRVTEALFNRTHMRLVMIDTGYRLVWIVVMGIILAVWH